MSVNQLAKALGIPATRLNDVVRGRRGITADTALRLARYLGTSAEFWLGLQLEYDLRTCEIKCGSQGDFVTHLRNMALEELQRRNYSQKTAKIYRSEERRVG